MCLDRKDGVWLCGMCAEGGVKKCRQAKLAKSDAAATMNPVLVFSGQKVQEILSD